MLPVSVSNSKNFYHDTHYSNDAPNIRPHYISSYRRKPLSILDQIKPEFFKNIFLPVLNKKQSINYSGKKYDIFDDGDFIKFVPHNKSTDTPQKAVLFFHGLNESYMKHFPGFSKEDQHKKSYHNYYWHLLHNLDKKNILDLNNNDTDLIYHRGYWGTGFDKAITTQKKFPKFYPLLRRLLLNIVYYTGSNQTQNLFGQGVFGTDPFVKSAAYTINNTLKEYPHIEYVAESMGNATFLEALKILNHQENRKELSNNFSLKGKSAFLLHPVFHPSDASEGVFKTLFHSSNIKDFHYYVKRVLLECLPKIQIPLSLSYNRFEHFLNENVTQGHVTKDQKDILLKGFYQTEKDIHRNIMHFEKFNTALLKAFPHLKESKKIKPLIKSKDLENKIKNILYTKIPLKDATQNISDHYLSSAPFSIGFLKKQEGSRLLNQFTEPDKWKVFRAHEDALTKKPDHYLSYIFGNHYHKDNSALINSHSVKPKDIPTIQDKNFITTLKGNHLNAILSKGTYQNLRK